MTTATTYPSRRVIVSDFPEITNVRASFQYNFFAPDELINKSSIQIPNGFYYDPNQLSNQTKAFDRKLYDRFAPRFNLIEWDTVSLKDVPPNEALEAADRYIISENLQAVYDESYLTLDEYNVVTFRDDNREDKTKFFLDLIIQNQVRLETQDNDWSQLSLQEITKKITDATPDAVSQYFLGELINRYNSYGIMFVDSNNDEIEGDGIYNLIKDVEVRSSLNNRFIADIMKTSMNQNVNFMTSDQTLANLSRIQESTRARINPNILSIRDYDLHVDAVLDYQVIKPTESIPETWLPGVFSTGYIVEKYVLDQYGSMILASTDTVENPSQGFFIDLDVRYGDKVQYAVSSVFVVQAVSTYGPTGEKMMIRFLVKAKPRKSQVLECIENIPPPPPSDFSISWDYSQNAPVLYWSLPLNRQRDIKYFQIYRRRSIYEPFELMRVYDFNDLQHKPNYNFPQHLTTIMDGPLTVWVDHSFFQGNTNYIYAVCCVDAHGYQSNYSQQLMASFNLTSNQLQVKSVVDFGAPKAYPNMGIRQDSFVDAIRTSGAKKMKLYFDPEYLSVFLPTPDKKKQDLKFLSTKDQEGFYVLQFINADLQEQNQVKINLNDYREKTYNVFNLKDLPLGQSIAKR